MLRVMPFIETTGIVKHRKQLDNMEIGSSFRCDPSAIGEDTCPMVNTMKPVW